MNIGKIKLIPLQMVQGFVFEGSLSLQEKFAGLLDLQ